MSSYAAVVLASAFVVGQNQAIGNWTFLHGETAKATYRGM